MIRMGTAILCDYDPQLQEPLARLWEAASLVLLVLAVWEVVRRLAVRLVEESLTVRAQALAAGELPAVELLAAELEALPLVIGADGVMVPFRPHPRTAKGKSRWREIKVAILARLGARLTREATRVTRLWQRVG